MYYIPLTSSSLQQVCLSHPLFLSPSSSLFPCLLYPLPLTFSILYPFLFLHYPIPLSILLLSPYSPSFHSTLPLLSFNFVHSSSLLSLTSCSLPHYPHCACCDCPGGKQIIGMKELGKMKTGCIVCNMGHSNQEIDTASLRDVRRERIRHNVTHIVWPDGKRVVLLADVSTGYCTLYLVLCHCS